VINATSAGLPARALNVPLELTTRARVVMDMVYKPLRPRSWPGARPGPPTVDGLEMLIRQASPSFEALFGAPPPATWTSAAWRSRR
jgi:shikimate dehydrogenase